MPSTYSSLLRLELMATGEKSATWGNITNTNLGTLLEKSIAGTATINVTAGNVTLTALNGADDEARCATINITGTPGVSRNVVAPSASKTYCVINGSNAAVVFKGAATTGVTLSAGQRAWVAWNGSDFVIIGVLTDSPSFTGTSSFVNLTVSGVVSLATGSVSAPSLAISGDANTGLYSPGADQMALTAGGVQRMLANSSGLVLSGTAGSYSMRVVDSGGTGDRVRFFLGAAGNGVSIEVTDAGETTTARTLTLGATNSAINLGGGSQLSKDANGRVLINGGASIAGVPLTVKTGTNRNLGFYEVSSVSTLQGFNDAGSGTQIRVAGNGLLLSGNNGGNDHFQIDTSGNLSAGGATTTARLVVYNASGARGLEIRGAASTAANFDLIDGNTGTRNWRIAVGGASTGTFSIRDDTGGAERLTIANTSQLSVFTTLAQRLVFTAGPTGSNGGTLDFENWNNSSLPVALGRIYCQTTSGAVGNEAADLLFYTKPAGGALASRLRLSDAGQIFAPAIHNNASGASGTTPMVASGTYTPTFTNISGTTANTPRVCQWLRVGNVVTVSGIIDVTSSSGSGVAWRLSLPIASDLVSAWELAGTAARSGSPQFGGILIGADTTNNEANFSFTNDTNTVSLGYYFTFTYLIR